MAPAVRQSLAAAENSFQQITTLLMATIIPNPVLSGMDMGRSFGQAYSDALREGVQQGTQIAAQKNMALFNALNARNMISSGLTPQGGVLQGYSPNPIQLSAFNTFQGEMKSQMPTAWATAAAPPPPANPTEDKSSTQTQSQVQAQGQSQQPAQGTNASTGTYEKAYRKPKQ